MAIEYHIIGKSIYKNTSWYYCSDEFTGRGIDKKGNIIIGNIKKQLSTSGNGGPSNNANGIIEFNDVVNYIETRSTSYNTLKEYEVYVDNIYKTTNTIESTHYSSEGFFIDLTNIKYYKFLLKQNNQYYTIKPEYYSNGQFQPLTLEGGAQPNENDYESFGFYNVNDLLISQNTETIQGIDKGELGEGKYFEVELGNEIKKVNNIDRK